MLDPRALTHSQLAEIVADVQAILWQESRMLPDFPREYGNYALPVYGMSAGDPTILRPSTPGQAVGTGRRDSPTAAENKAESEARAAGCVVVAAHVHEPG